MEIDYRQNTLTASDFLALRGSAGWGGATYEQVSVALSRSALTVSALSGTNVVGMGRLVGDGAIIWYVQDVIVLPEWQSRGIGNQIMRILLDFIDKNSMPGTNVMVGLMSAKGKEEFYRKLGFVSRPNEMEGDGMIMYRKAPAAGE